jgi:hypothetical protein
LSLLLGNAIEEVKAEREGNFELARLYGLIGRKETALGALRRALEARESSALTMRNDPLLASIRGDPRFEQLAATYGITPASSDP